MSTFDGCLNATLSPQIASGAEKMNSVCCCSPAALLLSGCVTSGALGFCVPALPVLTFSASHVHIRWISCRVGVWWVIQEGISAPTVSYLWGSNPKVEANCANGMHGRWAVNGHEQCG